MSRIKDKRSCKCPKAERWVPPDGWHGYEHYLICRVGSRLQSLNDAPLTRFEGAPSRRHATRITSNLEQVVLAQGLLSRYTLYPIALLTSSFTFSACSRDDVWSSNGPSRHGRQHSIRPVTCVCHRHQHNIGKARAHHHTIWGGPKSKR
jgi:hypothetical protein